MEGTRIQKVIADSGYCSRRKAEELIEQKRVKLNGHPAVIGQKIHPYKDLIIIDGERIFPTPKKTHIYLVMNKPRGYLTSMSDDRGRRCVTELLPDTDGIRVFPVGRLDLNSEGLLLFTSDGNFANKMTHPSHEISKTYRVTVRPDITDEQAARLSSGVYIDGRRTAPAEVRILSKETNRVVAEIVIREGRNRQIRKMCEAVKLEVARLKRTAIGPIRLGMLKPGATRELTKEEILAIRTILSKEKKSYYDESGIDIDIDSGSGNDKPSRPVNKNRSNNNYNGGNSNSSGNGNSGGRGRNNTNRQSKSNGNSKGKGRY